MPDSPGRPFAQAARPRDGFRDVHIKKVPEDIWRRARQNALASGLSFKEYVTGLLDRSRPFHDELPRSQQPESVDAVGTQQGITPETDLGEN